MDVDMIVAPVGSMNGFIADCEHQMQLAQLDCIWVPDHLTGNNLHPELAREITNAPEGFSFDYWQDPFIAVAGMAGREIRPRDFGIGVTDFIRRGPIDVARSAAGLSQLLNRPLLLGVGAGEIENLVPVDYDFPDKPVSHFEKNIKILREVLDSGCYQSDSGYTVNLGYNELPAQIWVGGQRPRMLRITAQYADGWFPAWKMSVGEYADKINTLREKSAAFNRPCPGLGYMCGVVIGESRDKIYEQLEQNPLGKLWGLMASGESWEKLGLAHPFGDQSKGMFDVMVRDIPAEDLRELAKDLPAEIIGEVFFTGSVEELFDELKQFAEAGMERCILTRNFVAVPESEEKGLFEQAEFARLAAKLRCL